MPEATAPTRLQSLDAMRGLVIALMLLVNMTWNREVLPAQLFHVPWNDPVQGATITDLVFPWFVFMMGAAVPISVASGRGRGRNGASLLGTALKRGAKLYLWGVLLTVASFAHERPLTWECLLYWNILQLIAAAYVVCVAVWLMPSAGRLAFVVCALLAKWATLLIPYDFVILYVSPRPIEGGPIGPGTWAHFDGVKQLLHMDYVPVATPWSQTIGWFGMAAQYVPLAAIAVIGGLVTEKLVSSNAEESDRPRAALGTAVAGILLMGAAVALQWGYVPEGGGLWGLATVPFSKWLFSPAYCLLAAGSGAVLLAGCFAITDTFGFWRFPLLQSLGKNALAIYVGAELSFKLLFSKWLLPVPEGEAASIASATQAWALWLTGSPVIGALSWALAWVAGWILIARILDRRRIYWRV